MSDNHFNNMLEQDKHARAQSLIGFFHHPLREQRHRALAQVVLMGSSATIPLIQALNAPERHTRAGALRALVQIGDGRAVPALMEYVEAHATEIGDNRAFAMQAIVTSTGPDAPDPKRLFEFLNRHTDDPDQFIRAFAYAALGQLGDPRAKPLLERGQRDPEPFVAEKASEAMERLALAPAPTYQQDTLLMNLDEIGFALQSGQAERRRMGLDALAERAAAGEAVGAVVVRLLRGPNLIGRQSALEAIARLRAPHMLTHVVHVITDPRHDSDLQTRALRALAAYGPMAADHIQPEAQASLLTQIKALLDGQELFARAAAVSALAALPGPKSLSLLLRAVHDSNSWVRDDASLALQRHAGPPLLPHLDALARLTAHAVCGMGEHVGRSGDDGAGDERDLAAFQNRMLNIIEATLEADEQTPHDSLVDTGMAALNAPRAALRVRGLELLRTLARRGARPALKSAELRAIAASLTSRNEEIILNGLALLDAWMPHGATVATASLVSVLHRGEPSLALRVIPLLGRAGDIEARAVLRDLAQNPHPRISQAATQAIHDLDTHRR